jgi:hypothetical protein
MLFYYNFSDGKQMSWNDANSSCGNRLEFPTTNNKSLMNTGNKSLMNTGNKSYWLGIYKKESCETHMVGNLTNIMELKLNKCPYVVNDTFDEQDCYAKSRAICVKSGKFRLIYSKNHYIDLSTPKQTKKYIHTQQQRTTRTALNTTLI